MKDEDKRAIKQHLYRLVQDMNVEPVLFYLQQENVFDQFRVETVKGESVMFNQRSKLIDLLLRSDDRAFQVFLEALRKSNQGELAELISPGSGDRLTSSGGATGPAEPPKPNYLPNDVPSQFIDVNVQPGIVSRYNPETCYRMESEPRGLCLIINNRVFARHTCLIERFGTDFDSININYLFDGLGFKVLPERKDKTAQAMLSELREFAKRPDHLDCSVVVILSHGKDDNGDAILGVDGDVIKMADIFDVFSRNSAPALSGKPKLFIIQACRGDRVDIGADSGDSATPSVNPPGPPPSHLLGSDSDLSVIGSSNSSPLMSTQLRNGVDVADAMPVLPPKTKDPNLGDFLICRSSMPGHQSFRNTAHGSWFIQSVVEVFMNYAKYYEINKLLTEVGQLISVRAGKSGALPSRESSLIKELYLNPSSCNAKKQ